MKELVALSEKTITIEKVKLSPVTNALFIGFLYGIIFFSIVKNTWGMLTLIPLYIAYKLIKDSKRNEALEQLLKDRNLK